ncbi:MAG TPA: 1-deoxy-D-xylulose-5-phosphate reductoisomerase [Planctomicrobium sp.]|nr:1-deoxy-D-xylulose-5-phosphate reductoisomerase [Planctomicrobium sp.]
MTTVDSKRIALLGATGSIGTSCQDVVRASQGKLQFDTLTAHSRWQELAKACEEFHPRCAVLTGVRPQDIAANAFPSDVRVLYGADAVADQAASSENEIVVSAIVGAAGLFGTWAAVEAGKTIALANKETLVVAGPLIMQLADRTGSKFIPVDSEHSAIFQALQCGKNREVARLILTASGGPFRTRSQMELERVTSADALDHPTWDMGPKITIDSATMMNKSLEIIEARWLFGFPSEQIDVVVHPQSIVHSMVEFVDGSILAQMSPPDMRLPVQYALSWPQRWEGISPRLDLTQAFGLTFEPPDRKRFPALDLGFEVARLGGTAGAVLNAANEVAVSRFLRDELSFLEIARLCRSILSAHDFDAVPTLDGVLRLDHWAREEAERWTSLTSCSQPFSSPTC